MAGAAIPSNMTGRYLIQVALAGDEITILAGSSF
jgi:hypothetical protein